MIHWISSLPFEVTSCMLYEPELEPCHGFVDLPLVRSYIPPLQPAPRLDKISLNPRIWGLNNHHLFNAVIFFTKEPKINFTHETLSK